MMKTNENMRDAYRIGLNVLESLGALMITD